MRISFLPTCLIVPVERNINGRWFGIGRQSFSIGHQCRQVLIRALLQAAELHTNVILLSYSLSINPILEKYEPKVVICSITDPDIYLSWTSRYYVYSLPDSTHIMTTRLAMMMIFAPLEPHILAEQSSSKNEKPIFWSFLRGRYVLDSVGNVIYLRSLRETTNIV